MPHFQTRLRRWKIRSVRSLGLAVILPALFLQTAMAQTNGTSPLVTGNTAFALDLYSQLKTTDGNLFFSPYSISTCLAMIYAGARGDTEKQMARVLHFDAGQALTLSNFGELQGRLNDVQKKKEVEFNLANGLWAQKNHPFLPEFLDAIKRHYEGSAQQVDFQAEVEPVRKEINDWVSGQTKSKITDLLQPGVINASTRLVLVNAIYFKGKWATQFKPAATHPAPFFIAPDKKIDTPMMNLSADFKFAEMDGLKLLELPYLGGDLSMVVLLPAEIDGLKALEDSLTEPKLNQWLQAGRVQKVGVSLPKFTMTRQFSLAGTLRSMGMSTPFSPSADLSGMDGSRDLFVSAVVHKAFVDINEEGTEAAAATGGVVALKAVLARAVFHADHPFLFLIRDTHSGSVLFMGRMADPSK